MGSCASQLPVGFCQWGTRRRWAPVQAVPGKSESLPSGPLQVDCVPDLRSLLSRHLSLSILWPPLLHPLGPGVRAVLLLLVPGYHTTSAPAPTHTHNSVKSSLINRLSTDYFNLVCHLFLANRTMDPNWIMLCCSTWGVGEKHCSLILKICFPKTYYAEMLLKTFNVALQQGPGGPAEPGIIPLVAGSWKGLEHPRGGAGAARAESTCRGCCQDCKLLTNQHGRV